MEINKVKELLESYLNISNLKEKTVRRYMYLINIFFRYAGEDYEKMNLDTAREFLNHLKDEKKLGIGTVNDYRSAIKYLYEVVLDKNWNDRKIPYIRGYKTLPTILEKQETLELLEKVDNIIYKAMLTTIYSSGLRISEAINLRISDIDPKRMQIYIRESKSGIARYAILAEKNLEILREYLRTHSLRKQGKWKPDDYLFCSFSRSKSICMRSLRNALKEAVEKKQIDRKVTVHTFRHEFAVHSLEEGADIFKIKKLLGHKSIMSTCYYLNLIDIRKFGGKSPFDT